MKLRKYFVFVFLLLFLFPGCKEDKGNAYFNATQYGLSEEHSGEENSAALQALIDQLSAEGGTIYIPAGEYTFAENGSQTIGSHCIKMRSNVSINGDGDATVLKPVGHSQYGLDLFYFNAYLDTGEAVYLENCSFSSFQIDASGTTCDVYTSAGKGFMFNLIRNCHWDHVTVKNTDATGFGVDCPLDCSIRNCAAIGCGKAASETDPGASGFGIGYGYVQDENMVIKDCIAIDNRKFGFFFEHQGRFDEDRYPLANQGTFTVESCTAEGNLFNFGGISAKNVIYDQCNSKRPRQDALYFENSSNCSYNGEGK